MFFDENKKGMGNRNNEDMEEVTWGSTDMMGHCRRYQSNKFGSAVHGLDMTHRLPATSKRNLGSSVNNLGSMTMGCQMMMNHVHQKQQSLKSPLLSNVMPISAGNST